MSEERRSSGERPVFITTSLDTRLAVAVSDGDTIGRLKQKVADEHAVCFPKIGSIRVISMKVRRKSQYYHLPDSMLVKSAFYGLNGFWFLHMDADAISLLKEDVIMVLDFSKADNGHPDKSSPMLAQSHLLGPPQSCINPLASQTMICNTQEDRISLDNLNASMEEDKKLPDRHGRNLNESALQGTTKGDACAEKVHVSEVTIPSQDNSRDCKVSADIVETGADFNDANNDTSMRSRSMRLGDNEYGASQKRRKKKAPVEMSHTNFANENQVDTNLSDLIVDKPKKRCSADKHLTDRLPEKLVPEGTGKEKNGRKRKSSNSESKLDSGLLSETNSKILKGSLGMSLLNHVGINEDNAESPEREVVQEKLDELTDLSLAGSDRDPSSKGEDAANSLLVVNESPDENESTKEIVTKRTIGTFSSEPQTKGVRLSKEITLKEKNRMQAKSRTASAKKVVDESVIVEAKNVTRRPSLHNEDKFGEKVNDAVKNDEMVDAKTKRSIKPVGPDGVVKYIQGGNGPLNTSVGAELSMSEVLLDKRKTLPKSKRRSLENHRSENGNTKLIVDGVPEFESQDKEPPNGDRLIEIEGKSSRSNLVNCSKICDKGTQWEEGTSNSHQIQVQDEHEDLNLLENSKKAENVVHIKKRKSSKSRKNMFLMTELNQKSEHDKSLEASRPQIEDREAIGTGSSCIKHNLSDELIVTVKQSEEDASKEKHVDQTGEIKTREETYASELLKRHEDTVSEALSYKSRTKSKAKRTLRTTKEGVHQKLDSIENLENIHSTDLQIYDGLALDQKGNISINMAHNLTNDEKEVKDISKKIESPVNEKIEGHLLSPIVKNHSIINEVGRLIKKRKRKSKTVKGDVNFLDSGTAVEKDGCFRSDVTNKTDMSGDDDKESVSGKNGKSHLLDLRLPKASQPAEPEAELVMKASSVEDPLKLNADDQLENGSKSTENLPGREPIQQSKHSREKIPPTIGRESKKAVANRQKALRAKNCSREDSSNNTEDLEGTVYTSIQGARTPAGINPYPLAGRKPCDEGFGTVTNQSNQKKGALADSDSIFRSTGSESSHDFGKSNKSDSATKSPDNSSAYSKEDTPTPRKLPNLNSPRTGSVRHVARDRKRTAHGDDVCVSQGPSGKRPLELILRNSSSYRKAKIIASQSMLDTAESEQSDYVPDSQAAVALSVPLSQP